MARRSSNLAMSFALAVFLAGVLAASGEGAEPDLACADEAAARVQERYDDVEDLHARITQRSRSVALGAGSPLQSAASTGEVWFAKPGRMRWSYQAPEPSLVVSDGEMLWIYDPTAGEVQVLRVGAGFMSGAAIQFMLGEGRLDESFEVKALRCAAERAELALHPRSDASYERIEIAVAPATGEILETTVHDLFGNQTHVVFEDVKTNSGLADSLFRFEPPEGVRVLTLPEAQ